MTAAPAPGRAEGLIAIAAQLAFVGLWALLLFHRETIEEWIFGPLAPVAAAEPSAAEIRARPP